MHMHRLLELIARIRLIQRSVHSCLLLLKLLKLLQLAFWCRRQIKPTCPHHLRGGRGKEGWRGIGKPPVINYQNPPLTIN